MAPVPIAERVIEDRSSPIVDDVALSAEGIATNQTAPSVQASVPSVISSPQGEDVVIEKQESLDRIAPPPPVVTEEQPLVGEVPKGPEIPETPEPSQVTLTNPEDGREVNISNPAINRQIIQNFLGAGFTLTGSTGDVPSFLVPKEDGTTEVVDTTEFDRVKQEFEDAKEQLFNINIDQDPAFQQAVGNITALWDGRIQDVERANQSRQAAFRTSLIRRGGRFVDPRISEGIISEEERQGMERVARLETFKQSAILEARAAFEAKEWLEFATKVDLAEDAFQRELEALADLNEKAIEQNKVIAEQGKLLAQEDAIVDTYAAFIELGQTPDIGAMVNFLNSPQGGSRGVTIEQVGDAVDIIKSKEDSVKDTSNIIEYNFARKQGFEGTLTDFLTQKRLSPTFELDVALKRASLAAALKSLDAPPKTTQAQETVAVFANRIQQANPTFSKLEESIQGMNFASFEAQIRLAATFQSDNIQLYMQASRNFINAILRRESGAVIADSEFAEARQQYLPQPGDSSAVLKEKEQLRNIVEKKFITASGPAFQSISELLGEEVSIGASQVLRATAPDGSVIEWDSLEPEERQELEANGYTFD